MRIAVIGGTGVAGRHIVASLRRLGHDAVVVARSRGVDMSTGEVDPADPELAERAVWGGCGR
jgi:uncharacterized protein YbjT (DUF2867 family)